MELLQVIGIILVIVYCFGALVGGGAAFWIRVRNPWMSPRQWFLRSLWFLFLWPVVVYKMVKGTW